MELNSRKAYSADKNCKILLLYAERNWMCKPVYRNRSKMGRFVRDILNQYNKVNDFTNSQCAKLLEQMHELEERDTAKKPKKYGVTDSQGVFYPLVGVDGVPYDLCPNCDSNLCTTGMFRRSKERMKYCEKCGQRLDWSE